MKEAEEDKLSSVPEIGNWIKIFVSPVIIFSILAFVASFSLDGIIGTIVAVAIFLLGILLGIWFAEKARKMDGTTNFMTRVSSTSPTHNEDDHEASGDNDKDKD